MNKEQMKKWIDESSYEILLQRWRFSPAGDPMFVDEIGDYYKVVMERKKKEVGQDIAVQASNKIGWEK